MYNIIVDIFTNKRSNCEQYFIKNKVSELMKKYDLNTKLPRKSKC